MPTDETSPCRSCGRPTTKDDHARLAARCTELEAAGRYLMTCLGAAADRGGWTRADVAALREYVATQWPELDVTAAPARTSEEEKP